MVIVGYAQSGVKQQEQHLPMSSGGATRLIVHVDLDAFYAQVRSCMDGPINRSNRD